MENELPQSLRDRLVETGVQAGDVLHAVRSGLSIDGKFGKDWAVATPTELPLITPTDIESFAPGDVGRFGSRA